MLGQVHPYQLKYKQVHQIERKLLDQNLSFQSLQPQIVLPVLFDDHLMCECPLGPIDSPNPFPLSVQKGTRGNKGYFQSYRKGRDGRRYGEC